MRNNVGPLILFGFLAVFPAGAGAQDESAASGELARLRERIAELEAEDARKTELIANLRARLAEQPLSETGARTLNNRIRNQILEIQGLEQALDRCETARRRAERDLDAEQRERRDAVSALRRAESDKTRAEQALRRAENDLRRAESDARRYRSEARRCN